MHDCYTVPALDLPVPVLHGHELYVGTSNGCAAGQQEVRGRQLWLAPQPGMHPPVKPTGASGP